MKKIQIVPVYRMEEMRQIFYNYLIELSQFDPDIKFDNNGTPIYKWFDCYWTDNERFPIYLIIDDVVAGLAMIRIMGNLSDIAEFYVKPEFRKDGNAIWFATEIAKLFEGEITFATRFTNPRAIKFWGKFANLFDNKSYEDDDIWRSWTIRKSNFKLHSLNLKPQYFELIKSGEKTLEVRLNDDKRKDFNVGDTILFYKEPEKIENIQAIILKKDIFNNFDEMADKLSKTELGFANMTKEEMIKVYRTIYSKENENKYGVVAFKIKVF